MAIDLNHTIVHSRNPQASAAFLTEILGRPDAVRFGPFHGVALDNGATLDFIQAEGELTVEHYAFLVSEDEFDQILGRIRARGLPYWADRGTSSLAVSTTTTGAEASTGTTWMATSWKSSPGLTGPALDVGTAQVVVATADRCAALPELSSSKRPAPEASPP